MPAQKRPATSPALAGKAKAKSKVVAKVLAKAVAKASASAKKKAKAKAKGGSSDNIGKSGSQSTLRTLQKLAANGQEDLLADYQKQRGWEAPHKQNNVF